MSYASEKSKYLKINTFKRLIISSKTKSPFENSHALLQLCFCFCFLFFRDLPVLTRMKLVIRDRGGFLGLYRGIGPGTMRSFLSNGTSMVVMANAQRKVSEWGLRD